MIRKLFVAFGQALAFLFPPLVGPQSQVPPLTYHGPCPPL